MLPIVLTMLVVLLVSGAVVVYVAFPHRGLEVPAAPWLGEALRKAVEPLPVLDEAERGAELSRSSRA
ncbi:hypothetical protein [Nocardioides limicola]|uniref:hypothetical protein n=1 Tax=Nocardioides limicola TaxID=2803368 RepID=UPI00193C1DE9|nr:hypothetical protein [Nocardioides sp. DJM-14]